MYEEYLRSEPNVHFDPKEIQPGENIIPINILTGVFRNLEQHRWLREHLTPTKHTRHAFVHFQISEEDYRRFQADKPPVTPPEK
jgi:hypothetical protein